VTGDATGGGGRRPSEIDGLPARPDAPHGGPVRPGRRWRPVVAVTAVMAVTVLGGFAADAALPSPVPRTVTVGAIAIDPVPGWAVVRRQRVALPPAAGPAVGADVAQLSRGAGALDVLSIRGLPESAQAAAAYYADVVLRRQLERLSVSALHAVVLRSGQQAVRFGYIGTEPSGAAAIEGSVTVAVGASGAVAVFDGWAAERHLELIGDELATMIDRADVS
jgi:hypothetical protein